MPTNAEHVLVDTSAALALVQRQHPCHRAIRSRVADSERGLAGHAAVEFLSVLTRLPPPQRLTADTALRLQRQNFPASRFVPPEAMPDLLAELVALGVAGGAFYDGLVGAAARAHAVPLLTCDRRAEPTYRGLGVQYELVVAG